MMVALGVVADADAREDSRQKRENVRLEECNQRFQKQNEHGKRNADSTDTETASKWVHSRAGEEEYKPHEREKNNVSGCHIGKKTDGECKRFDEY